ncbi:MAG: glycosyltransferase [Thermodesulforhabdaceae bacterium]|jgi:UDP-N-acetylglucosamine--N-acetylmuramyl-(pentapeptide) pyrophosphoryl-undecaprenol N-acetylglucosamine transferase
MKTALIGLGIFVVFCLGALWLYVRIRFNAARSRPVVVLCGGGTGGHVYPLLAILEEIRRRHPDYGIIYIGKAGKAEDQIIPREGIQLIHTWAHPFEGIRNPLKLFWCLVVTALGTLRSMVYLLKNPPLWVVSTGGYVSAPTLLAALVLRRIFKANVGIFLHEQNTIPGRVNLLLGRWVDRIFVSFEQTLGFFPKNGVVSGYPVRQSISMAEKPADTSLPFSVPQGRKVVFIFGGSQGARTINRAVVDALPYLFPYRNKIFIVHGRGLSKSSVYDAEKDTEERIARLDEEIRRELPGFYYAQNYFYNIQNVYAISDLVVARSGAGTISEIAAMGKPSILIPKSGLPGDHQVMNARAMKQAGAAFVIYEDTIRDENGNLVERLDGQVLAQAIVRIIQDNVLLATMAQCARSFFRRNASRIIVDVIEGKAVPLPPEKVLASVEVPRLWTNGKLLRALQSAYAKNPSAYNPLDVLKDEDELEYFRYRVGRLLNDPRWEMRNMGVKLAGYLLHRDKIPDLVKMIEDRTPVPLWQRMLGGDFREVGFIRRNALTSIKILGVFDKLVARAVEKALEDPYYEVRAEACRVVVHFADMLAGKEIWFKKMIERLRDPSFEVVAEAAVAIGRIGIDNRALDALCSLGTHHFWQVREAALRGILALLERHVICPSPELYSGLQGFILTSTDFVPQFPIRQTYNAIMALCEERIRKRQCPSLLPDQKKNLIEEQG